MRQKPKTIRAVHANEGVAAAYRARLNDLIRPMQKSVVYWITATYRANTPELAQDASPAASLQAMIRKLRRQWQRRFNDAAPALAAHFAKDAKARTDASLKAALKKAGFTVKFKLDRATNDVVQSFVHANVGLIKSISSEYFTEIEGLVMRSVQVGGDVHTLTNELQARYGVTRRRAIFIADDQNRKATSSIEEARRNQLGITQAVWQHSGGGQHPRPEHVASMGKIFDIKKGLLINGEYVKTGQKPNCKCISRAIIPKGVSS